MPVLVECVERAELVQVVRVFGRAAVTGALQKALREHRQAEELCRRKLEALSGRGTLPDAAEARRERERDGLQRLMQERARGRLGSDT